MAFAFGPNLLGKQILLPVHPGAIISRKKPVEIFGPVVKKGTPAGNGRSERQNGAASKEDSGARAEPNEL
jgi:hypothetical protein